MTISTAIDAAAVARVVGIKTEFEDLQTGARFLPQRVAVVGQGISGGTYTTTKRQVTSASEAGTIYGFGSPVHLAVSQLLPVNGDGVGSVPVTVYPLADAATGVAATGTITPVISETVATSYRVSVSGILSQEFIVNPGDSAATVTAAITTAINAVIDMPVTAVDGTTVVNLTTKWEGTSANDVTVEVLGNGGSTFTLVQPAGGLVNPDVDVALNQIGDVWETMIINCLDVADTASLDKFSTFNEGRWQALNAKPLVVFSGSTEADLNTAITLPDSRKTDRTNVQVNAPGSNNLPFVVAARASARVAVIAANNPSRDYGAQQMTGINTGLDGQQWTYVQQDTAVKAGAATTIVANGVMEVADMVTMYHPDGEAPPAYRYVCDIVKLQNIIYSLGLIFAAPRWNGAPLIPDNQATVNPDAKRPKDAKGEIFALLDSLGLNAVISDVDFAKANTVVGINSMNPKRLDISVTLKLAGNTNIRSIDLNFGFYYGLAA